MAVVTIAGGSGLIGMALSELLVKDGHTVNILTRKERKSENSNIKYSVWDLESKKIDENVIRETDILINLAGANLAKGKWTDERKKIIIESRVKSNEFLSYCVNELPNNVKKYISSSAVGYYGHRPGEILHETSGPGEGFLSEVCIKWESSVEIKKSETTVYFVRTGVVLSNNDGAFPKLKMGLPFGVPYFGSGEQMMSWIHIDDICEIYKYLIENNCEKGAYNAASPAPVSSKEMAKSISKIGPGLGISLPVPELALRVAMGEMAQTVLESTEVSADKIQATSFKFIYPKLEEALKELFKK